MPDLAALATALAGHGLILRGGFDFVSDDTPPAGPTGRPARSVVLVGNAGAAHWPFFQAWRTAQPADLENPLDTWSRLVVGAIAARFGARAVSPSDRPYLPFQQWAMRAEVLRPSPLGILMHPDYGLWHAYRGAMLFDAEISIQTPTGQSHLCDLCVGKPCMKSCPVDAYSEAGFAYGACVAHVRGASGAACRHAGCLDRNACPHGTEYRYPADVQAFHMAAFTAAAP
ncbi:MAG: 4Fe-4S dicluster domain-containing protein [Rhizobiaceae bacterium]|nr:4Fe-4S dicluster domain-containing protein [Rhizobiaceae bacterium]